MSSQNLSHYQGLRQQMYHVMYDPGDILDFYKKYFGELLYKLEQIEKACKANNVPGINEDFALLVETHDVNSLETYCSGRSAGVEDLKIEIRTILETDVPTEFSQGNNDES